jgi:signal transduction histidine kinase
VVVRSTPRLLGERMRVVTRRTSAAAGALLLVAITAATAVWLNAGLEQERIDWGQVMTLTSVAITVAVVGTTIVARAEVQVIGWLLLGLAFSTALMSLADVFTLDRFVEAGDTSFWVRLVAAAPWFLPVFACLATLAFLFPNGDLPSRRWRAVFAASFVGYTAFFLGSMLSDDPYEEPSKGVYDGIEAPFPGTPDWLFKPLAFCGLTLTFASLLAAVAAVVVRYRSSRGLERLQLRWLAFGGSLVPFTVAVCVLTVALAGEVEGLVVGLLTVATVVAVTAAVAIAVTRYRLYEIDWVVNRTLVYGAASAVLIGLWFAVALFVGVVLGGDSPWASGIATAVAALAFRPVRDRLQDAVDRRFSRARFDAREAIRLFDQSVRDGSAEPERIGEVVAAAVGDPAAEVLFLLPASDRFVDAHGRSVELVETRRLITPIHFRGARSGVLVHGEQVIQHPDLLRSVLRDAALAVEVARLRLELRVQLEEVERSRERIVRAGYEERRQLERDLHDGAQQRLVTLGMALRRTERSLPREARVLAPALSQAVEEIARAVADLRRLAAGVRPATLDDGLLAALEELAGGSLVPIHVDVPEDRLPAVVEAAAYFVACEAITNAVKHASPTRVQVEARRENGTLSLIVDDDGVGGARIGGGSGLQGLLDRVEAHGGTLQLHSPPGRGTRLEVELPCES